MPRSIEGIVEAHQLARERIAQGKPSWAGTLNFMVPLKALKDLCDVGDDSVTAQMILDAFHSAAAEVRSKVPQAQAKFFESKDEDLEHFVLTLEEWNIAHIENAVEIWDEFDEALERFYDWCDRYRWWLNTI